ncbi:hypothetical protein E2F46_15430 [Luteimonas aestuarii]|uniref:Peptidase M14 domain-containing protein n=1 Tax=Luteimonas aestuarii TaxID=453837 RepID=A0A4R5TKY3_9GAMM|nr:M14 family metallopeptidase [Luteimonas aestuarii]TDK21087.1 hypothetical protein E2F46_15430 [Luteimonas aestuarii]
MTLLQRHRLASLVRHACVALLAASLLAACSSVPAPAPDAAVAIDTSRAVPLQARRSWAFAEDGLRFDNLAPAARLTDVERLGPGHYRVTSAPETHPVNPSPWFGFAVHADAARTLHLDFAYPHAYRHRYVPKLRVGDGPWREPAEGEFTIDGEGRAQLSVALSPGSTLQAFAQVPWLPGDVRAWADGIAARTGTGTTTIGRSVRGRPLPAFVFGAAPGAPLLLVVGGQHPPEYTGARALAGFVEALAADTPAARAFRERVRVLVAPQLNPDGVLEGHWRTNANGTDLNRDWGPFAEPETRALRDALDAELARGGHVAFAIDFHSTFQDILYTVTEDPSRAEGGLMHAWIAAMQARFPGRLDERPSAAASAVFKNWAYCQYGAPTVTYEVGDTTPDALLGEVSRHAADTLMALMAVPRAAPAPADCTLPTGG